MAISIVMLWLYLLSRPQNISSTFSHLDHLVVAVVVVVVVVVTEQAAQAEHVHRVLGCSREPSANPPISVMVLDCASALLVSQTSRSRVVRNC